MKLDCLYNFYNKKSKIITKIGIIISLISIIVNYFCHKNEKDCILFPEGYIFSIYFFLKRRKLAIKSYCANKKIWYNLIKKIFGQSRADKSFKNFVVQWEFEAAVILILFWILLIIISILHKLQACNL